jgi:hypothetical protein
LPARFIFCTTRAVGIIVASIRSAKADSPVDPLHRTYPVHVTPDNLMEGAKEYEDGILSDDEM